MNMINLFDRKMVAKYLNVIKVFILLTFYQLHHSVNTQLLSSNNSHCYNRCIFEMHDVLLIDIQFIKHLGIKIRNYLDIYVLFHLITKSENIYEHNHKNHD